MFKKEVLEMLNNSNIVKIYDYNDFDPNKCIDGGKYLFWTKYTRTNNNSWKISYHTSSDFDYCDVYGIFTSCDNCIEYDRDTGECLAKYKEISTEELIEEIEATLKAIEKGREYEIEFYKDKEYLGKITRDE